MTTETVMNRRGGYVASFLPWLLAAAMLVVYLVTLGRTVTPFNLDIVADITGWNRASVPFGPVSFLITYPVRWLPAGLVPIVLNALSAVCAALTLALLARSVALLPHDRTNDQRVRELSDHSTLSIRSAWLPPLFAVLVCGLQMTYWENAIEFRRQSLADTGEMLNLLMFAYVIRCLLEYRISQRESWLTRLAVVYGLATANNWAMIGFFPLFLVAFIWVKGLDFFNWRFVLKILALGFAGFSLILLLPLINSLSAVPPTGFWEGLRRVLATEKYMLTGYYSNFRLTLILLSVTSILPVFLMGIRWASSFGDNNPLGAFVAVSAFNVVHAFFLMACLWVSLDPPFGPRRQVPFTPFLPLLYLGALSVGYYSGYFLLVFGTRSARTRQRPHPLVRWFRHGVTLGVWLLAIVVPAILVAKNVPQIRTQKATVAVLDRYFGRISKVLPAQGAVVISDNPFLLFQLQASLVQGRSPVEHLLIDTSALGNDWSYVRLLAAQHPKYKISDFLAKLQSDRAADIDRIYLLEELAADHPLYYLHPSFGYYFERFYPQPHGLVYELKPYATNAWLMPPLSPELIAENQAFWKEADGDLQFLVHAMEKPAEAVDPNIWQRFLKFARLTPDPNPLASALGQYYSRGLDCWGVELAKYGMRTEAGRTFEIAQQLNPDNVAARINQDFNRVLLAGKKPVIQSPKNFEDKLGKHRGWLQVFQEGGPFDEPNFCGALGLAFASGLNYRQAVQQFTRSQALAQDNLSAPLLLAWLYLYLPYAPNNLFYTYPPPAACSSNALVAADQALRIVTNEPTALFFKGVSLIQLGEYERAVPTLDQLIQVQATNYTAYLNRAIAHLKLGHLDAAKKDYDVVAGFAPKAYQANYGLGEIAYERKDTNAAIKFYEAYLTNSPPQLKDSDEAKRIQERLRQLKNEQP